MAAEEDLARAVAAWRTMFGERQPRSEDELRDELFHQSSEPANVVALVVRRHGFEAFLKALHR